MNDYSTPRVHRHRAHAEGDHSLCRDNAKCPAATKLWRDNRASMYAKAVFYMIDKLGGDAERILGDAHAKYVELAAMEFPDYEYLDHQPDKVDLIKAHMDVRESMRDIPVIWWSFDMPDEPVGEDGEFDPDAFFDLVYGDGE